MLATIMDPRHTFPLFPSALKKQGAGSATLPEIAAYDDFLEEYGPHGGWDRCDHECFEEMLRKFKAVSPMMIAAVRTKRYIRVRILVSSLCSLSPEARRGLFFRASRRQVQAMVVGATKESVEEHGQWYAIHEDLLLEKKAAIKIWRMRRDMAREEATNQRLEVRKALDRSDSSRRIAWT